MRKTVRKIGEKVMEGKAFKTGKYFHLPTRESILTVKLMG